MVADSELQRIMAEVDLDGNHTLDFQVGAVIHSTDRQPGDPGE